MTANSSSDIQRGFIFTAIAALLLSCLFGTSFALPDQVSGEMREGDAMSQNPPVGPIADQAGRGVLVDVFNSGRGFALKGDESHLLRFDVESIRYIEPLNMRTLLSSNKSLEEIRQEIEAKDGNTTYRGRIMLDSEIYPLQSIVASLSGDNITTVDADVAEPMFCEAHSDETTIAGHITVTTYPSDSGSIGKGNLTIDNGQYSGSYNVLLNMLSPMHGRKDKARQRI
jgi:hypothetical protein